MEMNVPTQARSASSQVDENRLLARLMTMAKYGATAAAGVNRQALSPEDFAAQAQLIEWGNALGMSASHDVAGNLFLRLSGHESTLEPLLTGSHLDSQPTGGRYDGVYGVIAALEAVEALVGAGIRPRRPIEVVAWMNEEGSRFAPGMMGSAVYAGARGLQDILRVRDEAGVSVQEALECLRKAFPNVAVRPHVQRPFCFLEAHIEQGPELESHNCTIGVVTGIQGKRTFRVAVHGEAAHAGTAPRAQRKDALLAATAMIQALATFMQDDAELVKFTVGRLMVHPNAPSVVPESAVFSIDLRHPSSAELARLGDTIPDICARHAGGCSVTVDELSSAESLEFPLAMRQAIRNAAAALSVAHMDIFSAAGHDARYLHGVCPTGMIFVPSHLGITHNEAEYTAPGDLAAGARVLAHLLSQLTA